MARTAQWWRPAVAVGGSLAVLVAGTVLRAGGAPAPAAPAAAAAARGGVTNVVLLAGTVPDDPVEGGTRTLSATPLLWVTGASLALDVRRQGGRVLVRQDGHDLALRPRSVLQGLPGFFTWTLLDAHGTVVARRSVDVCPTPGSVFTEDAWGFFGASTIDPADPRTPQTWPFPFGCGDPLTTHAQWGFPSGWAAPLHVRLPDTVRPGHYTLDARVNPGGAVHELTLADDHLRMPVDVLDVGGPAARASAVRSSAARAAAAGTRRHSGPQLVAGAGAGARVGATAGTSGTRRDGRADLPDLTALPSANIAVRTDGPTDTLRFNATVVNAGRGPLQVEGFLTRPGVMRAEQVLFDGDRPVSRRAAGAISLDAEEQEWHFDALARYRLVDRNGTAVATSGKIGFCFADVQQIDSANPAFVATPPEIGFAQCFGPELRSVQERLDPGYGDEYDQVVPEQELDITHVPNGTYRIQILVDPEHKLVESRRDNDVSLRTVVLGGSPGARTVTAPPVDGVDTEAAWHGITLPF